jgi:molybdenum cofactor cytidylyltransferase
MMNEIWAIVLAAGASSRMKQQKLLLPFQEKTVIEKVVRIAEQVVKSNIVVVLGADHEKVRRQTGKPDLKYVVNEDFMKGMLSSVICGFEALPENARVALLFLGDQPQIPADVALQVVSAWREKNKGIVIPSWSGKRGHPVLIETRYRNEIKKLDPEKGLRTLSEKFREDVFEVECDAPEILRDIDTPEDYAFEINKNK